jgi:hypothetical protein
LFYCCLFFSGAGKISSGCILYSSQFFTIAYVVTSDSSGAEITIDWNIEIKDQKTRAVLLEIGNDQNVTGILPSSVEMQEKQPHRRQVIYLIEPLQQSLVLPVTLTVSGVKQFSTCCLSILCRAYPDSASSDEVDRAFVASHELVVMEKFVFPSDLSFKKITKLLRKGLNSSVITTDSEEKTAQFALVFWNGIRLNISMKKSKHKVTLNVKGLGVDKRKTRKVIDDTKETLKLWNF